MKPHAIKIMQDTHALDYAGVAVQQAGQRARDDRSPQRARHSEPDVAASTRKPRGKNGCTV